MTSPEFKPASITDTAILLEMMEDFYAIDQYPFDQELTSQNIHILLNHPERGRIWLVSVENKIIGYVVLAFGFSFEYKGKDAFIDELYLKSEYRGLGIGAKVISFVIEEAKILGVKTLHLEAEKHNDAANHLYRKFGFKDNDRFLLNKTL